MILQYDKKMADAFQGLFYVLTPQECADEMREIIECDGEYYYPMKGDANGNQD